MSPEEHRLVLRRATGLDQRVTPKTHSFLLHALLHPGVEAEAKLREASSGSLTADRSRDSGETVLRRGAEQLSRHLDSVGLQQGWLILYYTRPELSWEPRLWTQKLLLGAGRITALGA